MMLQSLSIKKVKGSWFKLRATQMTKDEKCAGSRQGASKCLDRWRGTLGLCDELSSHPGVYPTSPICA